MAADTANEAIKGSLTKFIAPDWLRGKEAAIITGHKVLAFAVRKANVRWKDKRPLEYQFQEDPATALPDALEASGDPSTWEPGPDGKPRQSVVRTHLVYLAYPATQECLTYSTTTWGGRMAINELSDQIASMRILHPRAVPLVELSSTPWTNKFGTRPRPFFRLCGWHNLNEPEAAPTAPTNGAPPSETGDAMNDEIGF
jgi:hypothetical protein